MFARVVETPIANTFNGLIEMDFVDYGGYAEILHIRGAFSRFSVIAFTVAKKRMTEQLKWPPMRRFRIG